MPVKKWLAVFFSAVVLFTAVLVVFNVLTDPFGVFGDPVMDWYEYDMTMNPRIAKITYLDKNSGKYDSYIIGSSKCSSLSPEKLGAYTGGRYYNMTWYGGDLVDERALARYLIETCDVRRIVLAVDPQDTELFDTEADPVKGNMHWRVDGSSPLSFYAKYLFSNPGYGLEKLAASGRRGYLTNADSVYIAETGVYNKQLRDGSRIGAMDEYLAFENNYYEQPPCSMPCLEGALEAVADIADMCRENGVELTVIGVPLYAGDLARYDQAKMEEFRRGLAQIAPYYDFWDFNCVTRDLRYFYDVDHFRNCVGDMVLAYIYGDPEVWMPAGFGHLTTRENVEARVAQVRAGEDAPSESHTAVLPILMYHSFDEGTGAVTAAEFESQLSALRDVGYTAVTYDDLFAYVAHGTELPAKPVLITFDDGYRNNLDVAAPLLEEYGMSAAISVIGVSVGKDTYKDTGEAMTPHFSLEQALPWVERGILDIKSHSYDMHQVPERDGEDCRRGVLRMEGESEEDYVSALTEDLLRSRAQLEAVPGLSADVFTYPNGLYDTLSEAVLRGLGVRATVTTDYGVNVLVKGVPQSLFALKRVSVDPGMDGAALLARLDGLAPEKSNQ